MHPNIEAIVHQNQCRQKELHDFHARERVLVEGGSVLVKNFSSGNSWLCGVIYSKTNSLFTVDLTSGKKVKRHLDQVRKNTFTNVIDEPLTTTETNDATETNDHFPISLPDSPTVRPPPSDVLPRASEHSELRCSDRSRCPP